MVNDVIESLSIKITNGGTPRSNVVQFTETLTHILLQVSHMPCYMMGDYFFLNVSM